MSNLSKFRRVGELHKSRLNSITGWCLVLPDSSKKYSARFFSRTIAPHARAEVHGFIRSTILPTTVLPTSGTPNFQCLHRKYTISSIDSSQRFPRDYYPPYKRAVAKIISSKEFRSKKSLLISQGLWSEDTLHKFERWLLQTKPAVDQRSTVERWCHLREKWMAGLTSKSKNDANDSAEGRRMKSLSCISDLSSQCEALQSKIFTSSSDHNNTFSRMLQYIFHKLIHHCLEGTNAGASILPVVWYKMKESGVVIKQSKIRALLNAMIEPTSTYRLERSSKILLEELVMYHDLLSGEVSGDVVSEESFYQRYPAMLRHHCGLGDASAALALLMRIQALPLEIVTSDHYMLVLATLAENGHVR